MLICQSIYRKTKETSADIVQDSFAKLWQIREDFFLSASGKSIFIITAVRNKSTQRNWSIQK